METEIENLQSLIQADPSNFQARRELAILLSNNGFNEEALANLQYLSKYFPEDSDIFYNIGILYEKLKDYEKAKKSYEKALEIDPQDDYNYNYGEVLVSLELWDEAINAFSAVVKNDTKDGNCYFNLGLCYLNKDEINLAIDNFQKATELNPQDIFAFFHLGNLYQNAGLTKFAIENFKKVLEISPDYSWAYYNLACIAYNNNNIEEAKDYLLKTIQYNNQDIEAYKLLTKIYIKDKEFEEIITLLETRLDKEENGDLYYVLAQVYKYVDKKDEYIKSLEKSLENSLTLTFKKDIVSKEYDYYKLESNNISDNENSREIDDFEDYYNSNEADENLENDDVDDEDIEDDKIDEDIEEEIE